MSEDSAEDAFAEIIDSEETIFTSDEVRLLPGFIMDKKQLVVRLIENSLFPSLEQDLIWLKSAWPLLKDGFRNWIEAHTEDGSFIAEYLENEEKEFTKDYSRYVRKLREKVYRHCFKQTNHRREELSDYYATKGSLLVFPKLSVSSPGEVLFSCSNYYLNLGYEFKDGVAVNPSSIYYLARHGSLALTTNTFNLGVLPWVLDESISLQSGMSFSETNYLHEYGWSKEELNSALGGQMGNLSLQELVAKYRIFQGTDGYIDWNSVEKYKYISKDNLKTLAFEVFGRQPDVLEDLSYGEIVKELRIMSDKSLGITKDAKARLEEMGMSKVLSKKSESLEKSFWYPDLSGDIQLMLYGTPVSRDLIPVTYKTYLWSLKKDISYGYAVMIAQRLGLWKLISKMNPLNTKLVLSEIGRHLNELS